MRTKKKYSESNKKNEKNIKNRTLKQRTKTGIKFITINDILNDSQENINNLKKDDKQMKPSFDTFEDKYEEYLKQKNIDILKQNYKLEKKTIHDIQEALNNKKYSPVNDFYSYINDRWIKTFKLDERQKYITQIDNFRLTQDKIYRELIVLVENYIKEHKDSKDPFDISFKNYYNSFFKVKITKKDANKMKNHIKNYLIDIDNLIHENNLWKMLAFVNELDVVKWGVPLIW